MAGWQEVIKILVMLALIFFVGVWLVPKLGITHS